MDTFVINTKTLPLSLAQEGDWVELVEVHGGKNLLKRLISLGLIEGSVFRVLQHQQGQGVIISFGNSRLAIGFGMAHKIHVKVLEDKED